MLLKPSTVTLGTGLRRKSDEQDYTEWSDLCVPAPLKEASAGLLNCFGRELDPATGKEVTNEKSTPRGSINVSGKIPRAPYKRKLISKQLYR